MKPDISALPKPAVM